MGNVQSIDEGPRFIVDAEASEEIHTLAAAVESDLRNNPDQTIDALRALKYGTAAVRGAVEYFQKYPDGADNLIHLADFLDKRADLSLSLDDDSEKEAVAADPSKELIKTHGLSAEEVRDAKRRGRLRVLAERRKRFNEYRDHAQQNQHILKPPA